MLLLVLISAVAWRNATLTQDIYADKVRATVYLANAERALWQLRYGFPQFMVMDDEGKKKIIEEEPKWYKVHAVPAKKGKDTKVAMLKDKEVRPDQVIPMEQADFKEF